MSGVGEKERDLRNFRAWYYDNLGLRGVEQRKALDLLLRDDEIDLEKLSTFCLQFGLPAFRRPMVWKLLLGVLPMHQQIHEFVTKQQSEQVDDLLRTLKIIRKLSVKNDSIPSQIIKMYLLNEGELGFKQPSKEILTKSASARLTSVISEPQNSVFTSVSVNNETTTTSTTVVGIDKYSAFRSIELVVRDFRKLERKLKVLMSIAKLMCEIFENLADCFWVTTKFFSLQETHAAQLKTLPELVEQRLSVEDNELWKHLSNLGVIQQLPYQRWFESFFAEDLNDASLERVWDKIIAGSCTILVFVAVAILVVFRTALISKKTPDLVLRFLTQIPQERCETIVGKAIDLHVKYGTNIVPITTSQRTSL